MAARKEYRSDKIPSELERDAKCGMDPLLAGALINRLTDVDLLRLNAWLDMERRAAADEMWERHKDAIKERDQLRGWKKQAMEVLSGYDAIADTVGGKLGSSKIDNLAAELARLREVESNEQICNKCSSGLLCPVCDSRLGI